MADKEIQIPVPWGVVKGNIHGDERNIFVIALHGMLDNCYSFNNLVPLLPKSFCYFCFDLPGHGKSSHFVTKSVPTYLDFILAIKLVLDYFNKTKYILMGHSLGGQVFTLFAQMYPEQVEKLITIDTIYFEPSEPEEFLIELKGYFQVYVNNIHHTEETAPIYTFAQIVKKGKFSRVTGVGDELINKILQRSLKQVDHDKYKFITAPHIKYMIRSFFSKEYIVKLIRSDPVKCPHLLIRATDSNAQYVFMKDILEALKDTNKMFQTHFIEGNHDIHILKPQEVANIINVFLLNNKL